MEDPFDLIVYDEKDKLDYKILFSIGNMKR